MSCSGCAWRHPPPTFGTSSATVQRRFTPWTGGPVAVGCVGPSWTDIGARGEGDQASAIVDAASVWLERSIARLLGYRRLTVHYERKGSHFLAFLGLAAALTCYKKLGKLAR